MFSYSSTYAQLDLLKKVSKSADKLINPIDKSDKDISNPTTGTRIL